MGMDLSDLQALMGGSFDEPVGDTGGVWVVIPDGAIDDGILRLIGKARVVADALGGYASVLAGGGAAGGDTEAAIRAGADKILTAGGIPTVPDLAEFFRDRGPQAILFPTSELGRSLAPGLAQVLGGSLCGYAADVAVDSIYQRIVAHQPVLEDAARMTLSLLSAPAVVAVDTSMLPAAFNEPWRHGEVADAGVSWGEPPLYDMVDLPSQPKNLHDASTVVIAGAGLLEEAGFEAARQLAEELGGVIAGDVTALDAGWIGEEQLVGVTGFTIAPRLCITLGVEGDTGFLMGIAGAGCLVAIQADPTAPIIPVADYNVIGDPGEFARAFVNKLRD